MNEQLQRRLAGIRSVLMAHHAAGGLLPTASRGAERETLVREFLEKVFPVPYRFGTGAVADSEGRVSGQVDIVVEFPFFASFPAPGGCQRLYLAESVAFAIEVKSNLATQWQQVEATVEQLWPLRRRWLGHLSVDAEVGITTMPASESRIPIVAVGFRGHTTLRALQRRIAATPEHRRPDAALVVESGVYAGWQLSGTGEAGFFAFSADASFFMRNVITAAPDLARYL